MKPITIADLEKAAEMLNKNRIPPSELKFFPRDLLTGHKVAITVKGSNKFFVDPEILVDEATFMKSVKELHVIEVPDFATHNWTPLPEQKPITMFDYYSKWPMHV